MWTHVFISLDRRASALSSAHSSKRSVYSLLHFSDKRSEAQRGSVTYPKLKAAKWQSWNSNPGKLSPEPELLPVLCFEDIVPVLHPLRNLAQGLAHRWSVGNDCRGNESCSPTSTPADHTRKPGPEHTHCTTRSQGCCRVEVPVSHFRTGAPVLLLYPLERPASRSYHTATPF